MYVLRPHQLEKTCETMRAAETAVLGPTPGGLRNCMCVKDVIDGDGAGVNLARELLTAADVVRPDTGRQTELTIISQPHRFVVRLESHDWEHRSERLLAHYVHVLIHIRKHGRRIERT